MMSWNAVHEERREMGKRPFDRDEFMKSVGVNELEWRSRLY